MKHDVKCPRCSGTGKVDLTTRELLGQNLTAIREQLDITQDQMAERLAITSAVFSNMETGRSGCTIDTLTEIAHRLGVTPASLITVDPGADQETSRDMTEEEAAEDLREPDPEDGVQEWEEEPEDEAADLAEQDPPEVLDF